ncbi:class I adenylate-forming enzyme family protein [Sphingobium sp. 15-1]|uniref:class I adenylate-forming enzyme family protein n=1 Tax=Sphingobium sp. 15-1 TaxID=2729616 RepID=UPI00159BF1F3|nr:AMP-binding protein [Sphingobium sp. 15-1]
MYPIEFFWRAVARHPDRFAVLGNGTEISFAELGRRVMARAGMIQKLAPEPSTPVGIGAHNSVEHLIGILGVLAAGKVWVPLNPRSGDPEIARQIEFAQPGLVLADAEMTARIGSPACPVHLLEDSPPECSEELAMGPRPRTAVPLHTTQAIKFTGGSTGFPKGVKQPLRAWTTNIVTQIQTLGLTADDRYLVAAPLTHGTSTYMLPVLAGGGALIFPDYPKSAALLDAAERFRATLFFAPPALVLALVEEQTARPRDLGALRYLIYGGSPMPAEQIRDAQACFGPILCTSYGQTEAPQIVTFLPPDQMQGRNLRSVGKPSLLTQVAILDEDGLPVPDGEEGEIAVRGDLCMTGYFEAAEASEAVLIDGWLRTGDAGLFDEDGFLFLKDRLRDVIITGGFNVYPSDVEGQIAQEPAVLNCSVVGIPDPKWGEAVHAAIEVREGHRLDRAALQANIRAALGPVKTPKEIHIFDQLPRSAVGKLLKPAIREEIMRRRQSSAEESA